MSYHNFDALIMNQAKLEEMDGRIASLLAELVNIRRTLNDAVAQARKVCDEQGGNLAIQQALDTIELALSGKK